MIVIGENIWEKDQLVYREKRKGSRISSVIEETIILFNHSLLNWINSKLNPDIRYCPLTF